MQGAGGKRIYLVLLQGLIPGVDQGRVIPNLLVAEIVLVSTHFADSGGVEKTVVGVRLVVKVTL